ncbi:MAG: 2-oxoglutarate dehydrogenase complex dihydrolipoyllysine-residue succinyltransferase [Planctomyces sp.]|jgi:2-oxoglutarate dehydrogenase E2 component (dihydrolipoamide succinyltransferase)|nr:dihydrolipoyllysine-residue succinyltransferase component of 2-oxoglutarate dehydrogenase complex [Planctomycetia bacterium]HBC60157.1 dihydrolipoamide succinyltransferase [Planctomycetaceae bacterium]
MSTPEIEIKVPKPGESISEVMIGEWYIQEGQYVAADRNLVALESDKATFDVPAPRGGILTRILKKAGESAQVEEVIGFLQPAEAPAAAPAKPAAAPAAPAPGPAPAAPVAAAAAAPKSPGHVMPAAERLMAENKLPAGSVAGSGPGGRVLKEDVIRTVNAGPVSVGGSRETRSVPLSPIRQTIARRLVEAQHTAALLTTFNEVDMSAVKKLREVYKDSFEKKHNVKLGFMSFFVRAVVAGLQQYPQLNAQMNGKSLTYFNYCDVGVAIGGGKGLVVPVLRNAENMSFADIELAIVNFANRAKNNQIALEELEGGTFTITNGGVYGSLLSTPIVNPPQSGVLGMHGIFDRPVAVNGQVVIRPMMYIALTYDHRIVDGREAVSFLKLVKDLIEDPTRLILEV